MKNNYKQLTKSPSESSTSILKRSASHALRSSFRLPKKRINSAQLHALNIEQLPTFVPPKAAALLQISFPPPRPPPPPFSSNAPSTISSNNSLIYSQAATMLNNEVPIKIATIRKRSVWANGAAKISLPSSYKNECDDDSKTEVIATGNSRDRMHIGGFNFLQQNKTHENAAENGSAGTGILKEFNKNTSSTSTSGDNFKVNKKYKFGGHVNKSFEPSSAYALFECVEDNQYDQLKSLLEQKQLNVNALNNDGFSVLDLAVLINNRAIIKLLLQHGAQTGSFPKDNIESHLNGLLTDAEKKLSQCVASVGTSTSQGIFGIDVERQKLTIEKRIKLIRKMINGWKRLKVPDPPFSFTIDVIGGNSVLLKILEPIVEETICTTFKVQYSPREDFSIIIAEKTITEWNIFQGTMGVNFHLDNLIQRRRYYFRACSGNIKGYGSYKIANPASIVPSSWKDIEEKPRDSSFLAQRETLESINKSMMLTKLEEQPASDDQRRKKKSTTIKQLFSTVSKFQKSLRRGSIYLACIIFSDEKVLVTNEDFIPVIEIDESYPTNLNSDFYWLMKISTSWEDVKNLRIEMEKNSTNKIQFRFKILNAIHQLQMSLGLTDLGQFYYKPLKDTNGTIVLSCSLYIKDQVKTSTLHTKWISMSKLQKKVTVLLDDSPINEILLNSIQSQINYYQASKMKLSRGLYLGYLKMFSSMDTIQITCASKLPNVLPHCKIRDNPHVSAEEWSVLKRNLERDKEGKLSQAQENFVESLKLSLNRLFKFMNINGEDAMQHRIFDNEVIELNEDVSFLIVCPPPCDTIISKDSSLNENIDISLKRSDLVSIPLIVHEMIQFNTYQQKLLQNYARLSFLTEFDIISANLKQREAFSSNELQIAKDRLKHSEEIMADLNAAWKSIRWMTDVIAFYRSKEGSNKLDIKKVLQFVSSYNIIFKIPDTQMRGFHVKSPIRGSWAAPQKFTGSEILMYGEHSKSEQLLNSIESQVAATKSSADTNRKASIDSTYFSAGEQNDFSIPRLPTSKSEDTLVVTRKKTSGISANVHQRKRPTTVNPLSLEIQTGSSTSSKSSGLVVHRINQNHQVVSEVHSPDSSKSSNEMSPSKSKLRVSHHPKSSSNQQQQQKKEIKKYHAEEESTLVTFLKPTLTAIQNESHNRSFKDPLLIVEDEAIEMISSPFSKTPVERSKSGGSRQQLFGKANAQFFRSGLHSKNVHAICQDSETEPVDWRAIDALKQIEDASEATAFNASQHSLKSDIQSEIEEMLMRDYVNHPSSMENNSSNNNSSILQVYAAYDSGLATGTSLKLKCTQKTTAKDLVDLVVKQLNMAVVLKGKDGPIYGADQLNDFCLVAVIGARERCLRDDFKPLDLQNPWRKGKLFVRFKHDLLSAIEINASNREALSL